MQLLSTVGKLSRLFFHTSRLWLLGYVCGYLTAVYGICCLLAGFGATAAPSAFGTNFGLGSGATAFGQTQGRPANSATPFSMCDI